MSDDSKQEPRFTGINYVVCSYCLNLMKGIHRDGFNDGCKLIVNNKGKCASQVFGLGDVERVKSHGGDAVSGEDGCDKFTPNGMPAHPSVLEQLITINPLCKSIPSDPAATETSWDFEHKLEKYLPRENYVSYEKIQ